MDIYFYYVANINLIVHSYIIGARLHMHYNRNNNVNERQVVIDKYLWSALIHDINKLISSYTSNP
jgi:hypothetical protein